MARPPAVHRPTVENLILESGKSEELRSMFAAVAEAEIEGEPKFTPRTNRALARAIACRTYASALLELSHLIVLADACTRPRGGFVFFFWDTGPARAFGFRECVFEASRAQHLPRDVFEISETEVAIRYSDGTFTVTYARMPFLSALLEFLVCTVGYRELEAAFAKLLQGMPTVDLVSKCASEIARLVYDYLKAHLPSAQNQRKYGRLVEYLKASLSDDFDTSDVDDAIVLDFWRTESPQSEAGGPDFRTFRGVFQSFVRFVQAIEVAANRHEVTHAAALNPETGEVDMNAELVGLNQEEESDEAMRILDDPPTNTIKFLNKRERTDLELLMLCDRIALDLPISLMRTEVFGRMQAQISQALRAGSTARRPKTLIDEGAREDYEERRARFSELATHVERMRLATFYALVRARRVEAIGIAIALRPELNLAPLKEVLGLRDGSEFDNVIRLREVEVSQRFLDLLEEPKRLGRDLASLMSSARTAFRRIEREGFDDDGPPEGFIIGSAALTEIGKRINAYVERLKRLDLPAGDWDRQFTLDQKVFTDQFHMLYVKEVSCRESGRA